MKLFSRTIQRFWLAAIIILLAGFAMFINFHETKAAISNMLNFAGKVTNVDGSEVTDGNYDFTFSLYNAPSGGTAVWTETLDSSSLFAATVVSFDSGTDTYVYSGAVATSTLRIGQHLTNPATGEAVLITAIDTDANTISVVDGSPAWSAGQTITNLPYVEGGVIDVNLGAVSGLDSVDFNQAMYLEITFNGETMQPRKLITSVAQAFNSDTLDGYHASDFANLAGNSTVTGEWTFENILSIATSSSETALSITQNGSGDIINLIGNSGQEVFTVTNIGNVGIGTSTPENKVDVVGDLGIRDQNELRLYELASNGNNYVGFRASSTLTSDLIWTLPTTAGTVGQALMVNSNGDLEWGIAAQGTVSSGLAGQVPYYAADGDTLTATSTIYLANSGYVGIGTSSPLQRFVIQGRNGTDILNIASSTGASQLYINKAGNIGLGTTTPSHQLSLTGNLQLPSTTAASPYGIIYKNGSRFIHDFSYGNNGSVTPVGYNTFIGINSGNFTMGSGATLASQASYNTGLGANSLTALTLGYYNTAIGYNALSLNTSGYYNTGIGNGVMGANTTGYYNTAIGNLALGANTTGYRNIAIGNMAGYYTSASASNQNSNSSIYIGDSAKSSASGNTNEIVIGYNANGLGSNTAVLGNSSITKTALFGNVGIGTTTPLTRLYVSNGNLAARPAMTSADVLVVENSPSYSTAINLLSTFEKSSYIAFSNEFANGAGYISYIPSSYQMQFSASGTIPLALSGNGNVSIGSTTNPEVALHVHKNNIGTTRPTWSVYDVALFENSSSYDSIIQILAGNTRSSGIGFSDNNARNVGSIMYNHLSNAMTFTASGTQRMIINNSGYVGIGTESPSASLTVQGMAGLPILNIASSTGTSILYIDAQGEIGIGTNNPDTLLTIAATSTQMKLLYTGSAHAASFTVGSDGLFTIESNEPGDVYIDPTSKLGVGTSSPTSALSVYGDVFIEGPNRYVNFGTVAGSGGYGIRDNGGTLQIKNSGTDWTNVTLVGSGQVGWVPRYYENSPNLQATSSIYISNAGYVGIGDTSPTSQLSLGGNIDMNGHDITEIGRLDVGTTYGYGLRFNNANGSMITWGNDSTHQFGGVNISGIKINTGALDSETGVTFGPYGAEPTASINANGTMTLGGFAYIGGGRMTISEFSSRASSSILVETSQGIPFLEFATGTGEVYMFVNKDGWLGLNTNTPNTFLHVGSADPDKVGSGENVYVEGSVEIDGVLYIDGTSATANAIYMRGLPVLTHNSNQNFLSLYEDGSNGNNYLSLMATSSLATNVIYTLPSPGTIGQALILGGNNNLYWGEVGTGSGDVGAGVLGQFPYYGADGTALTATSSLYLSEAGYIGIGTTTPAVNLDIYSFSGPSMYLRGNNSGFKFTNDSGINYIESVGSNMTGAAELRFTDMNAVNTWMVIGSTGNVSIGTSTPVHKFDVYGNATTYITQIRNINTSASSAGLSIQVDGSGNILNLNAGGNDIVNITPAQSSFYNKVVMYGGDESVLPLLIKSTSTATTTPTDGLFSIVSNVNTSDNVVFKVDAGGNYSYDGSASSPAADYAEYFFTNDRDLKSGEVVCVDVSENNAVKRCERASDGNVMGIVSTQPAIIGNAKPSYSGNKNYIVVGMLGQVPAKVSDENGSIRPGDSLTSASLPGFIMKANAGDSTVGVALETFGNQAATGTPAVVSTGEIKVLISRRNKSLTVEMVEDTITEHIAAMEIEDEVQILIANAVNNLNLGDEIQPIVDEQINQFDQRLSVEFDVYDNRLTTIAVSVDGLAARLELVENNVNSLAAMQVNFDNQLMTLNEKLILLEANNLDVTAIKVDPVSGLAITDDNYYEAGAPSVSVVEIETASSTTKTAFVVNQLGDGDVVDFQADGVSIVNIADSGKVSVVGEMSIDGRLMVCAGAGCGAELDEAVDGTMGDMGVEGKVVAGAFESVCDEGFVWVPGSAKYGTMPGFCVMRDEARIDKDSIPTTELTVEGQPSSPWTNVSQGEAQLACQAMGDNYHLINENEWMTLAENIIRVGDNDIELGLEGLQLATGDSTVFTLSNGNKIYNLAGSLSEWTDMIVTRAGLLMPTADGWQEYHDVTDFKGFNIAPPYYYDSSNGIGRIKVQDNENVLRGFVRGTTSLYDLDLSYPPTQVDQNIGFRCAK